MIPPCFSTQNTIPRPEIIPPRNHPPPEKMNTATRPWPSLRTEWLQSVALAVGMEGKITKHIDWQLSHVPPRVANGHFAGGGQNRLPSLLETQEIF